MSSKSKKKAATAKSTKIKASRIDKKKASNLKKKTLSSEVPLHLAEESKEVESLDEEQRQEPSSASQETQQGLIRSSHSSPVDSLSLDAKLDVATLDRSTQTSEYVEPKHTLTELEQARQEVEVNTEQEIPLHTQETERSKRVEQIELSSESSGSPEAVAESSVVSKTKENSSGGDKLLDTSKLPLVDLEQVVNNVDQQLKAEQRAQSLLQSRKPSASVPVLEKTTELPFLGDDSSFELVEIPEPAPTDLSLQRQMPSGESSDEVQGMRFLGRSSQLASEEDSSSFEQSSLSHAERQEFSFVSGELSAAVDCIPLPSKTSGSLAEDADTKRLNVRADGPPYLYASRHTLSTLPTETEQPALLSGGLLASARLESVLGWGMVHDADMYVIRPSTVEQLQQIFAYARREGRQVTLRGSGQSYGDASIGRECILTDLSRMKRILSWSPQTGIVDLEPGVRIMDLWRYTLEDGWWPPVVSGTMKTSFGGGLGVNIHGKNSYKYGTLGEHILELDVLTPDGKMHLCTPQIQPELFYSVIGSGGLLGVITRIRLRMKRVYSGNLCVHARSTPSLTEMRNVLEANLDQDYLVGWVDTLARGRQLGRGTLHLARYLNADEDPTAHATLKQKAQEIPDTVLGVVPKSMLWMGLWMFLHETGMRWVNRAKFYADQREEQRGCYMQSHAAFNFLLDYVPGWQRSYRPGGLIQYQTFVPKEVAVQVFEEQLCWSLEAGCPPFLGVFKKHRVDPFLLSYNVDGYSFALDYPVRKRTERRLQKLLRKMTERVLEKGGRFYLAKDGILLPEEYKRAMPEQILQKLRTLKRTFDPQGILVSELARRLELLSKR